MPFSRLRWFRPLCHGGVFILLVGIIYAGCTVEVDEDEVFDDAREQVEQNVLPEMVDESQAVFRNLLNFLAALPELCATPIAALGRYVSSLPGLGRPDTVEFDDDDNEWTLIWLDRVLGDNDPPLTVDTNTPRVDIILQFFYLSQGRSALRAIPFALTPQTALQLAREPPSYAAGDTEGFFLSQDAASGQWRLRWRALNTPKVFQGSVTTQSGVFGVLRRITGGVSNAVTSLDVDSSADTITFEETTDVTEEKGFTFFVRPGERVEFQLGLGPVNGSLQSITREQLRIGADDQPLPLNLDITDFVLSSLLPSDPTGTPVITPGRDLGMFMWQDVVTNGCAVAEDQWRIRFSRPIGSTPLFSGTVSGIDDDGDVSILSALTVGSCPAGSLNNQDEFSYDCALSTDTESGYDLCVTAGGRLSVRTGVNDVEDPRLVFIGGNADPAPSPLPFSLFFDIDIAERQSATGLELTESAVSLLGNSDENEDEQVIVNPDQVSFDPLCRQPRESVQPRVRLNNDGEYSTSRFEGSAYALDQVVFTDRDVESLADSRRFPDRGEVRLITRVQDEPQKNSAITALMLRIRPANGQVNMPVDMELVIDEVDFVFQNQNIILTVE